MILPPETLGVLVVAAVAAVVVLAVVVSVQSARLAGLRRSYGRGRAPAPADAHVPGSAEEVAALRADVATVHANSEHLSDRLDGAVSRVGLVRYDAFEDMGGALSFSAALLDERGTGLVLSAINGRSETRCYAKPVVAGTSDHHLSHEELAAIDAAVAGGVGAAAPARRRRRQAS